MVFSWFCLLDKTGVAKATPVAICMNTELGIKMFDEGILLYFLNYLQISLSDIQKNEIKKAVLPAFLIL